MITCTGSEYANGIPLPHFRDRVLAKDADYKTSGPIVVVAFGDSVTMGATALGEFDPENVYHNQLKKLLTHRFTGASGSTLSVINSGIGGDTSAMGLIRIHRDVIRYQPDLVIVGFAANDLFGSAEAFEANLCKIVDYIRAETAADVIFLTPTHMASRTDDPNPDEMLKGVIQAQKNGVVRKFAEIINRVGASKNVPVADVYKQWDELANRGVDTTSRLANGINHPVGAMHSIPASLVMEIVNRSFSETLNK